MSLDANEQVQLFQYANPSSEDEVYEPNQDSGLLALVRIASKFGQPIEPEQLLHDLGKSFCAVTEIDILRHAEALGMVAEKRHASSLPYDSGVDFIVYHSDQFYYGKQQGVSLQLTCPVTDIEKRLSSEEASKLDVILFKKQPTKAGSSYRKAKAGNHLSHYLPLLGKHKSALKKVLLASIVIQAMALAMPKAFQVVIDTVLVNKTIDTLHVVALVLVVIAIYEPALHFIRSTIFSHLSSSLSAVLFSDLFKKLLQLPLSFYQKHQAGHLTARLRELDHVRNFLAGSALMSVIDLLFVGVFLSILFYYSVPLASVLLAALVFIFVFWLALTPFFQRRVDAQYQQHADNVGFLTESIAGVETIKTSATQHHFNSKWQEKLSGEIKAGFRVKLFSIGAGQGIVLIQKMASAVILWLGTYQVIEGNLSVGELVAFNMLAAHVTLPILRLAQLWQDLQQCKTALGRLSLFLDEKPEPRLQSGQTSLAGLQGKVEFSDVIFRYHKEGAEVLSRINFTLSANSCLGITGHSGSGKSTITALLQKLYLPNAGQIYIDDVDLSMIDSASLRRQMGVVLQESKLFNATIRENIIAKLPTATKAQLDRALKLSGVETMLTDLPQGLETEVGEGGEKLSGGQRQRVAIARAILHEPRIVIFDEATSALDYESEQAVLSCIQQLKERCSLIIVSHRLNALKGCDTILTLSKGSVVESGDHETLMKADGYYASLYTLQTADE